MHVGTDHNPPSLAAMVGELGNLGWFDDSSTEVMQQLVGDGMMMQGRMDQLQGEYDGQRIDLIWRNLDPSQAAEQARAFVDERVDLIVAFEDKSIRAAQDATADPANRIPVVFLHPSDPVRQGLVNTLSHPGGNLTGVWGARDPLAKQLELLSADPARAVQPLRLLTLVDPTDAATHPLLGEARDAAEQARHRIARGRGSRRRRTRGCIPVAAAGRGRRCIRPVTQPAAQLPEEDPELAAAANLPVQAHRREWVDPQLNDHGALFSVGVDIAPVGAAGAHVVDSILKGATPADIPAQEVPKIESAISLRRAAELGIEVPEDVRCTPTSSTDS